MTLLLDTCVWVRSRVEPHGLPSEVRTLLSDPTAVFGLSAISIWEIAKLAEKGRFKPDRDILAWIHEALVPTLVVLPITPEIAVESTRLPNFHADPADQLIAATARIHRLRVITPDGLIQRSGSVPFLWS